MVGCCAWWCWQVMQWALGLEPRISLLQHSTRFSCPCRIISHSPYKHPTYLNGSVKLHHNNFDRCLLRGQPPIWPQTSKFQFSQQTESRLHQAWWFYNSSPKQWSLRPFSFSERYPRYRLRHITCCAIVAFDVLLIYFFKWGPIVQIHNQEHLPESICQSNSKMLVVGNVLPNDQWTTVGWKGTAHHKQPSISRHIHTGLDITLQMIGSSHLVPLYIFQDHCFEEDVLMITKLIIGP